VPDEPFRPDLHQSAMRIVDLLVALEQGDPVANRDLILDELARYVTAQRRTRDEQTARQVLAGRLLGMSEGIRAGQPFDELADRFAELSTQCDEWAERWDGP